MRAAIVREVGSTPEYGDFQDPEAGDGLEVGDVVAAGLNPVDLFITSGMYGPVEPPFVAGLEGVARLGDGRHVYFNGAPRPFGSMAERVPVDPNAAFVVPDGLDHGVAVALGIAGLAGWLPLAARAQVRAGETVLVLGATGVVGRIAVQAAKLLGAGRVVAAGRHRDALDEVRGLGADEVVVLEGDLGAAFQAAAGDGYDVVVDAIFGPPLEAALPATAIGARIVTIGAGAGQEIALAMGSFIGRTLIGYSTAYMAIEVQRAAYERMARHAAAGELRIDVETVPLADVAAAWQRQASGSPHRKIVLAP
jgi:NADPH:quinone reductase-like Zn-dependent oxidoreductase